mmetsp:Transcript_9619/g.24677  ORF Transcript_9619/g.24677 Transcript_9619/m.24677 type:complete len:236 (+) Transcript_9619:88-795(+)
MSATPRSKAIADDPIEIFLVMLGDLCARADEPTPMKAVYEAIDPTVPTRNATTKAKAEPLALRVRAGRTGRMASGERPCRKPVPNVVHVNLDRFVEPSIAVMPLSEKSLPSLYPTTPMKMRVIPTAAPANCSITFKCDWRELFRRMKSAPKKSWPTLCPRPQSPPRNPAEAEDLPIESGAKAARWSGPVSEWRAPAKRPAEALSSMRTALPAPLNAVLETKKAMAAQANNTVAIK